MRFIICLNLFFVGSFAQTWHEYNGEEYYIDATQYETYDDAIQKCNELEATLVVIKSEEVDNFINGISDASKLKRFQHKTALHRLRNQRQSKPNLRV